MTDTEHARIELRADTAANWTSANPTLAAGEPGWESDTKKLKIGDGATAWTALAYYTPGVTDPEVVRDTIAAALVAGTNVTIAPDDGADTITITAAGGGGGGGAGGVLAFQVYNPGTITPYATTSTSVVDVDATNLAVTVVAPASGKVLLRVSGLVTVTSGVTYYWAIRQGTTTLATAYLNNAPNMDSHHSVPFVITGLTPGTSYTFKLGHKTGGGSGTTYAGGAAGQTVIEAHALP